MKTILLFLTCFSLPLFAQQNCGTHATPEVLQWWKVRAAALQNRSAAKTTQAYTVPLRIHLVGYDNGSGFFGEDKAYQLVCELNQRFAPLQISFFMDSAVARIPNSLYANPTAPYINQMMGLYNNPRACNLYLVPALAGMCGLAYFPNQGPAQGRGGIVLKNSCAGPGNSDPAHEMGHYFSLLHTFQGAGGSNPELVNGSNCTTAGDFFCDTPPDWQDFRWNCPYTGNKQDPNGDFYQPDSSLYMGYSNTPCPSRFSAEQQAAIVFSRANDRPYLDSITPPVYPALVPVNLLRPTNGDTMLFLNAISFRWRKVAGATAYNLRVSDTADKAFQTPLVNVVVADTSKEIGSVFDSGRRYHWTVLPLNGVEACVAPGAANVQRFQFSATRVMSVQTIEESGWEMIVLPNPASSLQPFQLHLEARLPAKVRVEIASVTGTILWEKSFKMPAGKTFLEIPSHHWPAGVYLLRATAPGFCEVRRLLKTD